MLIACPQNHAPISSLRNLKMYQLAVKTVYDTL